ncbi:MAG: TonB-dependent receptor [Prevotellaceae bacterium]|jgi:hypothetical protein|nr:TonB-dependent receptor [Prevotellaceae bacterium]
MKNKIHYFFLFLFVFRALISVSQTVRISGRVTDEKSQPLEYVNVLVKGTTKGTSTDGSGVFELFVPEEEDTLTLQFRFVGFSEEERKVVTGKKNRDIKLSVMLKETAIVLGDYSVRGIRRQESSLQVLDVDRFRVMPNVSGGIEALVQGQLGVNNANNELSSQYSVRGGNYDENSVYVNNIEVYRPLLIRAGQQEGLSFVNPDMVESVTFSSGGFSAQYGDKMSSALDITYKKPEALEGSVAVSLLGASAHIGTSSSRFSQLHGVRYKTSAYLLGTLDTDGEYSPDFFDYQTYLTYTFSPEWETNFLGNISRNSYNFIPETRTTSFGTMSDVKQFTVFFDGQEKDLFQTLFGAWTLNFKPTNNLKLSIMSSAFSSAESETYDITGEYWLSEIDGSGSMSIDRAAGIGVYKEHARNRLNSTVLNISQLGTFKLDENELKWGVTYQRERITDRMNEWEMRDSAGFSMPLNPDYLSLYYNLNSDQEMSSNRFTAYLLDTYSKRFAFGRVVLTGGVRANYWDFNDELLISPRASVAWFPKWKEGSFGFRLATGIYYQAPFYKEIREMRAGENRNMSMYLNSKLKAPRSSQILLGSDYYFRKWERPFKFTAEIYYKYIDRIIPYRVDNVKVIYSGQNNGDGYATGVDLKLFGEFVPGTDSWVSLSLMQTKEDIYGDGTGYIPRPTDQRYNVSLFFQDYFPGFPKMKINLKLIWADGLPFGPPRSSPYLSTAFRASAYRRVDIGATYGLIAGQDKIMDKAVLKWAKALLFNLEVFNLLGIRNINSYYWITDVTNIQFAVPNYLTGRLVNLRVQANF